IPVGKPTEFDVITAGAGPPSNSKPRPNVVVTSPSGMRVPCTMAESVDGFTPSFTPTVTGPHTVAIDVGGIPVKGSPFRTHAAPETPIHEPVYPMSNAGQQHAAAMAPMMSAQEAAGLVRAFGDGLYHATSGRPAHFTIDSRDAPPAPLSVTIEGPAEAKINYNDNGDGTCGVEYLPTEPGPYVVNVLYKDVHIKGSPFPVRVAPPGREHVDVSRVHAYGPGLQPTGVLKESFAKFTVDAKPVDPQGRGLVKAIVVNPHKQRTACLVQNNGDGTWKCSYSPIDEGRSTPAHVVPRAAQPGVYDVTYVPNTEGPCQIEVRQGPSHVARSPFTQHVLPAFEPQRVRVTGEGVHPSRPLGLPATQPTSFHVDTRDAGIGDLELSVSDPEAQPLQLEVVDHGDGTYTCHYRPMIVGRHTVRVKFGGQEITESPFLVPVAPSGRADLCRIESGNDSRVPVGQECVITLNTSQAGIGQVTCRIVTPSGATADVEIQEAPNGRVHIYYTPPIRGDYLVEVRFGGELVPNGRFNQRAVTADELMADKAVTADELMADKQPPTYVQEERVHHVTTQSLHSSTMVTGYHPVDFKLPVGPTFSQVEGLVRTPSGRTMQPTLIDNGDGTVTAQFQPNEPGLHELEITYNGQPIPGSPFRFYVEAVGSGIVTAYGPGLSYGRAGELADFTLVTKEAGAGGLSLSVEGPSKAEIQCNDNKNGTCSVSYLPLVPGDYTISIKFMERHIPGSPFTAHIGGLVRTPSGRTMQPTLIDNGDGTVTAQFQPNEPGLHELEITYNGQPIPGSPFRFYVEAVGSGIVTAYGPGLSYGRAGELADFTLVTKEAGAGGLSLSVEGPSKAEIQCNDNKNGTCSVSYLPLVPGDYTISIKFMERHIPGSPFTAHIGGETRRLNQVCVGTTSEMPLRITETDIYNLVATVRSPSGQEQPSTLKRLPNGHLGELCPN
ncbi:hypothetical protein AHF37_07036, partial [Paragonimus kellicotti]